MKIINSSNINIANSLVLMTPRMLLLNGSGKGSIDDKKFHSYKYKYAKHRLKACLNLEFTIIQTRYICFHPQDILKYSFDHITKKGGVMTYYLQRSISLK